MFAVLQLFCDYIAEHISLIEGIWIKAKTKPITWRNDIYQNMAPVASKEPKHQGSSSFAQKYLNTAK